MTQDEFSVCKAEEGVALHYAHLKYKYENMRKKIQEYIQNQNGIT